jgi:hypothetical protein
MSNIKVVYKPNAYYSMVRGNLIVGEIYDVIDRHLELPPAFSDLYYEVGNGLEFKVNFITLEEYRNNKIDEVLK